MRPSGCLKAEEDRFVSTRSRRTLHRLVPERAWKGLQSLIHPGGPLSKFGNDTFWSVVGNVVMQSMSFGSTLMVARLLTKEEFGQYAVFLSSVALLGTLAGLGLGVSITTTAAGLRSTAPGELGYKLSAAYWIGAVVTLGLCAVVAVAWAVIGDDLLQLRFEPLYLGLVAATLAANTASMLQAAELGGYQSFRSLAVAQSMRGLAMLPLCVAAAILFRLPGVISAAATATAIGVLAQALMLRTERKKRAIVVGRRPRRRDLSMMLSCSAPAFFTHVASATGNWGANVTVALSGPAGIGAVAEFGAASQVRNLLLFLPNIVGQVLMPTIANIKSTHGRDGRRLVGLGVAAGTGLAILLAAVIVVFRHEVALLFGSTYAQASGTVALIAVGGVLYVAQSTLCYALIGYGHIRWVCFSTVVAAATFILLAGALIALYPGLGSRALAWGFIAACALQLTMVATRFNRVARSPQTDGARHDAKI